MYIVTRRFQIEKGYADSMNTNFLKEGAIERALGFIKLQVLLNTSKQETDQLMIIIYWQDKEAYMNWEKSPEHLAGHRAGKRPKEILGISIECFDVIGEKNHQS